MIKEAAKAAAYLFVPQWAATWDQRRWLRKQARMLRAQCLAEPRLEKRIEMVRESPWFRSNQMPEEIFQLLKLVQEMSPRRLCEIGADRGGTLLLLSLAAAPDAHILSIDIDYPAERADIYRLLAGHDQALTCLEADSHNPDTLAHVERWLAGDKLDFLFVDGDHGYQGVVSDFQMYAPLVRGDGIVAFHDIVPDAWTRHGIRTTSDVGEVPRFWRELKAGVHQTHEFVENSEQDGYGIGVVRWNPGGVTCQTGP